MPPLPLCIVGAGMVTSLGLDVKSSCAAIRCGIDNFQETQFCEEGGEWQIGGEVPLAELSQGRSKLLAMAAMSVRECLQDAGVDKTETIPLMLCLPETDRPGRLLDDDDEFFQDLQKFIGKVFAPSSRILCHGHTAAAVALKHARDILGSGSAKHILVVGVDSLLSGVSLQYFQDEDRLLTSLNSNGFIPGEGAACILLESGSSSSRSPVCIHGLGFAMEDAIMGSGKPFRANGLSAAVKQSLRDSGIEMQTVSYRVSDVSGEHYYFKETALAMSRNLKVRVDEIDLLHPADCIGEIPAAIGIILFIFQMELAINAPEPGAIALIQLSDSDGKRAVATVMKH